MANLEADQSVTELRAEVAQLRSQLAQLQQEKAAWMALPQTSISKQYQILAETAPVGMFYTAPNGHCLYVNQWWCEISGMQFEQALGHGWGQALHPDDRDRVFAEWNHALATEQTFSSEYRFVSPTGKVTWVFGQAVKARDAAEAAIDYVGTITDITARKQAEAALRESEERWQLAIAASNDGIWDHDLRTNHLFISPRCHRISGIAEAVTPTLEELISRVHPQDGERLQHSIAAHLNRQMPYLICEYRVLHSDGTYRWVLSRGKALWDEEGTPIRMSGSMADIHDRKQAEAEILALNVELEQRVLERTQQLSKTNQALTTEIAEHQQTETALREAERRLRSLLENVRLVVVGLDANGCVDFVNPFCLELTGYTQSEVIGKDWFATFLPPEQTPKVRIAFKQFLEHNFHPYYQNSIVTKSGEERIIAWNNTLLRDTHGTVVGTMSIGEDITERQIVERMKNEFISIVSHELRTPLTSIRGSLGLLAMGILDDDPEQMHHMIRIASTDTERLVRLVNDILELEKLEAGKATFVKEICQATDLIQRSVEVMQASAQAAGVNLVMLPQSIKVWGVPDRILQTLTNLLSNAIKFSEPGDTVWVSAKLQHSTIADQPISDVVFQVKDQGRGIPADQLESIFGRFQQVDASDSRAKGGTGLGLAICQSIVQQHGGRIWAESVDGEGSCFFFTLPTALS